MHRVTHRIDSCTADTRHWRSLIAHTIGMSVDAMDVIVMGTFNDMHNAMNTSFMYGNCDIDHIWTLSRTFLSLVPSCATECGDVMTGFNGHIGGGGSVDTYTATVTLFGPFLYLACFSAMHHPHTRRVVYIFTAS